MLGGGAGFPRGSACAVCVVCVCAMCVCVLWCVLGWRDSPGPPRASERTASGRPRHVPMDENLKFIGDETL